MVECKNKKLKKSVFLPKEEQYVYSAQVILLLKNNFKSQVYEQLFINHIDSNDYTEYY